MRFFPRVILLVVAIGCGGTCPETSRPVFPPPAEADDDTARASAQGSGQIETATTTNGDEGPPCGIPLGASKTEITQRFGEPEATSEPQEVSTEYHYYGKLLIIYRMNRVDDVILQDGGKCPE